MSKFQTLDGEGGRLTRGRWNSGGVPVAYLAESAPGALWEVVVHFDLNLRTIPPTYTLLRADVPDTIAIEDLPVPLEPSWKADESVTRVVGDRWLQHGRTALARVPSALFPGTFNYLLNPAHAEARDITVGEVQRVAYDVRFVQMLMRP